MNRMQQIEKAAASYSEPLHPTYEGEENLAFQEGALWADDNPEFKTLSEAKRKILDLENKLYSASWLIAASIYRIDPKDEEFIQKANEWLKT